MRAAAVLKGRPERQGCFAAMPRAGATTQKDWNEKENRFANY